MKIVCPMCDGNSAVHAKLEIVLDCDWCNGQGWIDDSENRFYASEDMEPEAEERQHHPEERATYYHLW